MKTVLGLALIMALNIALACESTDLASGGKSRVKGDDATGGSGTGTAGDDDDDHDDDDDDGHGGGGPSSGTGSGPGDPGSGAGTGTSGEEEDQAAVAKGEITEDEGNLIANLPGARVLKVGVNFEDQGDRGDKDHNDAVLCFSGKFKVEGSNVVSIRNQQVVGTTSSISGCQHNIRVAITHADGTTEPFVTFASNATTPVNMNFRVGSKLEVFMTSSSVDCDPGVEKSMHNAVDCKVLPDVCITTGG